VKISKSVKKVVLTTAVVALTTFGLAGVASAQESGSDDAASALTTATTDFGTLNTVASTAETIGIGSILFGASALIIKRYIYP